MLSGEIAHKNNHYYYYDYYGSSNLHFMQATTPDNDVHNEVPVLGHWKHPSGLVHAAEVEERICDGNAKLRADGEPLETLSCYRYWDDQ